MLLEMSGERVHALRFKMPRILRNPNHVSNSTDSVDVMVVNCLGELFFHAVQEVFCMTRRLPSAKTILSSSIGVILTILCDPMICFAMTTLGLQFGSEQQRTSTKRKHV